MFLYGRSIQHVAFFQKKKCIQHIAFRNNTHTGAKDLSVIIMMNDGDIHSEHTETYFGLSVSLART